MYLEAIRRRLEPGLSGEVPIEGMETRMFEALPETVAPLVSLFLDPLIPDGLYLMLDMGAGTTEVSVNLVSDPGTGEWVLCFADVSNRLRAEDLEAAGADGLNCTQKLLAELKRQFHGVWARGYRKESGNPVTRSSWKYLTVLFTGGGSLRPAVQRLVSEHCPIYPWPRGETRFECRWHTPSGVDMGPGAADGEAGLLPLLSVAHGLSLQRQMWPRFFSPDVIEPQEAPSPAQARSRPGLADD